MAPKGPGCVGKRGDLFTRCSTADDLHSSNGYALLFLLVVFVEIEMEKSLREGIMLDRRAMRKSFIGIGGLVGGAVLLAIAYLAKDGATAGFLEGAVWGGLGGGIGALIGLLMGTLVVPVARKLEKPDMPEKVTS